MSLHIIFFGIVGRRDSYPLPCEVGDIEVIEKPFHLCAWALIGGLLTACGSGSNDTTSPGNTQGPVEATTPSGADSTNSSTEGVSTESEPAESVPVVSVEGETGASAPQDTSGNSGAGSTETNPTNPQSDGEQASSEAEDSDGGQSTSNNQRVNFGTAKLLVDLVPNGDSYPAKFHRAGDKLYFWTIDTDPRFGRCSRHWGSLDDSYKDIAFNLVATHPETGAVSMNSQIMTLGDFAEDPNYACAGYNSSVMQVFKQQWIPSPSATGEQQFVLHFDSYSLGPDQAWTTDGSTIQSRQQDLDRTDEQLFFEGDKVFFVDATGISVADTLSGDRRKLYEINGERYYSQIKRIAKSPARQATFEIAVAPNRYQIWMYDLDTDEWAKKFSIKPDSSIYEHYETLLVDGETLLSLGNNPIEYEFALGYSSNYGDVTSFDILTDASPSISYANPAGTHNSAGDGGSRELVYSTTDFSTEPYITSVWMYREERIEKLFSASDLAYQDSRVITGNDGKIYITGTKVQQDWPNYTRSLELWSYDPQSEQLVELSDDDWHALKHDHPTPDEDYLFRYLNTPDGLMFVNLKDDTGREVWFTDGTREGTRQLADINPGTGNSDPQNFHYSGNAIYFSANDGTHGHEPWMIRILR